MAQTEITHLTLADRSQIETGIRNGATQTAIAKCLGKNKTCISKEIAKHRSKQNGSYPIDCAHFPKCIDKKVCAGKSCQNYTPFSCRRRDHSPGACNGCRTLKSCHFFHYSYSAVQANHEYRMDLVGTRQGVNMTTGELRQMGETLKPLIDNGLSPYSALKASPSIGISTKALYNYIEDGVFKDVGINISDLDLRRKVSRKPRKLKKVTYKKRNDRTYLKGREFADYKDYVSNNPSARVVQMDTVYNDVTNGPFIQTFKFMNQHFLFCIYHEEKTAAEMTAGINLLEKCLGREVFSREVQVILTDRGSEFSDADAIEKREDGSLRTRIFYCDPMRSNQKGSLENNHEELRYVLPHGMDLHELGLVSQDATNVVVSHVNSFRKELLVGKSPIDYAKFLSPDLWTAFEAFGIKEIDQEHILLKPNLLKQWNKEKGSS